MQISSPIFDSMLYVESCKFCESNIEGFTSPYVKHLTQNIDTKTNSLCFKHENTTIDTQKCWTQVLMTRSKRETKHDFRYCINGMEHQISFIPKPVLRQSMAPYLNRKVFLMQGWHKMYLCTFRTTKRIRPTFRSTITTNGLCPIQAE